MAQVTFFLVLGATGKNLEGVVTTPISFWFWGDREKISRGVVTTPIGRMRVKLHISKTLIRNAKLTAYLERKAPLNYVGTKLNPTFVIRWYRNTNLNILIFGHVSHTIPCI